MLQHRQDLSSQSGQNLYQSEPQGAPYRHQECVLMQGEYCLSGDPTSRFDLSTSCGVGDAERLDRRASAVRCTKADLLWAIPVTTCRLQRASIVRRFVRVGDANARDLDLALRYRYLSRV